MIAPPKGWEYLLETGRAEIFAPARDPTVDLERSAHARVALRLPDQSLDGA